MGRQEAQQWVEEQLREGRSRVAVKEALLESGWSVEQAESLLSDQAPQGRGGGGAEDRLLAYLMYGALFLASLILGIILTVLVTGIL